MWISGAVLLIGIAIFLGVFLTRGTAKPAAGVSSISSPATDTNPYQNGTKTLPHVKPSASALQVVHRFLVTAVARKDLASAYDLVGPMLKAGVTRAQWIKGNNPVTYYPAKNLAHPSIMVKSSTKNHLVLEIGLVSKKHSSVAKSVKSLGFLTNVDKIRGRWLVTYFLADYKPSTPASQGSGQGPN
jgi:hypothetical protein